MDKKTSDEGWGACSREMRGAGSEKRGRVIMRANWETRYGHSHPWPLEWLLWPLPGRGTPQPSRWGAFVLGLRVRVRTTERFGSGAPFKTSIFLLF